LSSSKYDVVIIGSGAGGGAAAWALSKKGFKVLVLEAGPHYIPEQDYKLHTPLWEKPFPHKRNIQKSYQVSQLQALDSRWDHLRSWNHLNGRLNPTNRRVSYGYHHVKGVGGSSLHFTGEAHRLNPQAMKMFSDFGVAADWPMTYQDLEPYYTLAEGVVGVAGPNSDPYRPRSSPYPETAHPLSHASKILKQGFNKLGLGITENSLAVLSSPRQERLNCNYCGGCLRGCPRRDKGSIDVTYLSKALKTGNCEIRSNCSVKQVESDTNDTIKGVHYKEAGTLKFISAPILIIACGAIETPRLLLASSDSRSPNGLSNESGQVGQNFMETLLWTSNGLHPDALGSHRGLPVDSICWDFNAPDAIPGVIGGCRFGPSLAESDLVGPISYATRVTSGWGKAHKQKMRESFGHALSVTGICESLPNKATHITLSSARDADGMPLAKISSLVDLMAIKRLEFMAKKCRDILTASGVTNIFEEFSSYDIFSSTHVSGTCRMGANPETSVVDPWCRSHRWQNLYIVDSSVFPSSGGGESPGLTIQALALRTADNIAASRQA